METDQILVELTNASVRIGNSVILSGINWILRSHESWVVFGGNGAGKTTFFKLVRGDIWPAPECGKRLYCENGKAKESPIGFREKTGLVSPELLDCYRREGWNLSGLEVVCTGFHGSPFLYETPTQIQLDHCYEILALLGMEELADRRVLRMSQGEAKKILIARALVHRPRVLFLDEAAAGLDAGSKEALLSMLEQVAEWGTRMIYAAHDDEQIPSSITRALALGSGSIIAQGTIAEVSSVFNGKGKATPSSRGLLASTSETNLMGSSPSPVPLPSREGGAKPSPLAGEGRVRGDSRADDAHIPETSVPGPMYESNRQEAFENALIQIQGVDVSRHGKRILRGINWTMRPRENWAIVGNNGSGKTTLLKLLSGELRPIWGGTITRFMPESPRNLWEIRRLSSFVTPDLQHDHVRRQTGLEMVLSGFYGSVGLPREATLEQIGAARSLFELLGIEELEHKDVPTLSHGQIRLLFILRAIVTGPKVLLLDEPMSGLDAEAKRNLSPIFENLTATGAALVYVTHRKRELPSSITHVAVLEKGQMIFQGLKQQWKDLQAT